MRPTSIASSVWVSAVFDWPCLAVVEKDAIPEFFTLRLAMGAILGACCWVMGNRFPRYDQRVPAIMAICGFVIGYVAGVVLFFILLGAGLVAGFIFVLYKRGPEIAVGFQKWNQERLRKMEAMNRPNLAERIRRLNEKRDRDLEALEQLDPDIIDEEALDFQMGQVRKKYEEDFNRIMREHNQ